MAPRAKEENAVKKGDKVQAKWSGSNIFYPATVMAIEGKQIKVQYEDGSISSIKLSDVKGPAKSPPATAAKTNRVRSRSRSGARKTRSRSRSPARKGKAAAPKAEKKAPKSEKKNNLVVVEKIVDNKQDDLKEESIPPPFKKLSPGKNSSTVDTVDYSDVVEKKITISNATSTSHLRSSARSSARIAALQTARVSTGTPDSFLERKRLAYKSQSKSKYSDDEDTEEEEDVDILTVEDKGLSYLSFSGVVLKMILLPLIPLYFCFACHRQKCDLMAVPQLYANFKALWNSIMIPLASCLTFHLVLTILSKIPIGREMTGFPFGTKNKIRKYRLNGLYILLLFVVTFGGLAYFKMEMNWGYEKVRAFVISSVIYTLLWSTVLHLRALFRGVDADQSKSNQKAGFLGNFFYGHEVNPILYFDEDVKTRFIQFGLIGLVLLDMSILTKFCLMKGPSKALLEEIVAKGCPLILTVAMQLFMIADYFWREDTMLSTAVYTNDGVGYAFLATVGSLIPSIFALQGSFLISLGKSIHLPHWCSAIIVALFACGYYLYASSSNLKHNFRRNPFSPSLGDVESIPTSKKKRLIVSGPWGVIRHPNYLGFIIMVLASSFPCGFSHILPHIPALIITLLLVLRSFKIEAVCREKYGPAWVNYVEKVPNRFIPYIF